MLGQTIARRYRLLEVIGRGGHCVVYRAADLRLLDEVAVKVLHDSHVQDAAFIERMNREYSALDALRGTAAVSVHAFHRDRNDVFLVTELLRGKDYAAYLSDAESEGELLSHQALVASLSPIVHTLDRAHAAGIVHRDLKPGNIFVLDGPDELGVRLLDFGLAAVSGHRKITGPGMVIGSPSYIAPEMWSGDTRRVDHRADIYSLSAIIFRVLAGRVPFPVKSMVGKLRAATKAERPSPRAVRPELPRAIDEWARQALAIAPGERFSRVSAMWNALLDAIDLPDDVASKVARKART